MKTICIDIFSNLPVPALRGGAIETIFTNLIEQNELDPHFNLILISKYDKEAKKISDNYKYTKIYYIKKIELIRRIYDKIIYLSDKVIRKINKKTTWGAYTYYKNKKLKKLLKINADLFVFLGPDETYRKLVAKNGIDKMLFHIEYEEKADELSDSLTNRAWGVSQYVIDSYFETSKYSKDNGKVILSCVDEDLFLKKIDSSERLGIRKRLGILDDDFVVLYTGRINEEKGIHKLIDAVNSIDNMSIKLLICGGVTFGDKGTSDFASKIERSVNDSNGRIVMTGFVNHNELYKYYQIADVQVVPSLWEEAAGLVNVEGMLSGLPLIVTRSGGIPEYVDDKCAFILEKDDTLPTKIKEKIEELYTDVELRDRMKEASLERSNRFRNLEFYKKFIKLMDEMIIQ